MRKPSSIFEHLRPIIKPKEQLQVLEDLVRAYIQKYSSEKAQVLLQKELPPLLKALSKDHSAHSRFFSGDVFSFISLLCETGDLKQAQRLMSQGIKALKDRYGGRELFEKLCKHKVFPLLCKMGQVEKAEKLMDKAIATFRKRHKKRREIFPNSF